MRQFTQLLTFCLFGALPFLATAQGGKGSLDGTIKDSTSFEPIEYALVSIHREKDSSVVGSIYTNEHGAFVLEEIPFGNYFLKVFADSYNVKYIRKVELSAQKPLKKFGNIALVGISGTDIEEIVIQADKNPLVTGIDKKVYNVGDDISVTGGTANDVLNNVPSVEIDQEGKISLRGDGNVTILIDGKPSTLSGGNGKSLLDGLPAGSIERIEIVTNPSAKYDPDGTSGIINIVLKKNLKRGLNGNFQVSGATGNAYNASTGLSTRNTKYNLYGNYSFDYREGYRNNYSYLTQLQNDTAHYLDQIRKGTDLSNTHTAKVGMDIYLNDRNTLSWNVTGNTGLRERTGDQDNIRYTDYDDTTQFWRRVTSDPSHNQNIDAAVGYHLDFKESRGTIDWNAYQSFSKADNLGYYTQDYLYPDASSYGQNLFSYENNQYTTLSMDVVRIFKDKWRTETGLKAIHRTMNVDSEMYTDSTGTMVFDSIGYFDYQYLERIYSGYGIIASTWKKFKYQVGVRLEQSYQEPQLLSTGENYLNKYFNVFPSAHTRYELSKGNEFSFGYSKRINRPNSESLNPFTSYADPYNLRRGNPSLSPEYIHSFDLGFEHIGKMASFTISGYQRFSYDVISRVKVFYEDGTSAGTQANIDNSVSTGGEMVFQFRPKPTWRNMVSTNVNYIKYSDKSTVSANFNREGFAMSFKASSTLELMKKTLTLQANLRYSLPSVTPSGTMRPRGAVDLSADKSLKDGKWGVGMRVTDIFNTQGFKFYVDQPLAQQDVEFKWLTRRLYVSVRYRFGKVDLDKTKGSNGNGNGNGGGGGFDF